MSVLVFPATTFIMLMLVLMLPQMAAIVMVFITAFILALRRSWLRLGIIRAADDHAGCRAYRRPQNRAIIAAHFFSDHAACGGAYRTAHHRPGVCGKCRCTGEQQSCQ